MFAEHTADLFRREVEPLVEPLGLHVTTVPWEETHDTEYIVTVWDADEDVVADVFHVGQSAGYVLREVGLGKVIGMVDGPAAVPALLREKILSVPS